MGAWTTEELELLLSVDKSRAAIARAHLARMLLPQDQRISAPLSRFLPIEEYTKAWFIHDEAGIPICSGWPRENGETPAHHFEFRQCWNDQICTEWQPLPDVKGPAASDLLDYLTGLYGSAPTLQPVGFGIRMVEDQHGYQYRWVTMPALKIPTREEVQRVLNDFRVAPTSAEGETR